MIPGVVEEAARRFRDRVALVDASGAELTYFDLFHNSEAVAAGLNARGISVGDVVALALPSSLDYVVAYLAAARLGAITTGINPRFSADERARVIARSAPKLVIATAGLADGIPSDVDTELVELGTRVNLLSSLRGDQTPPRLRLDPDRPATIVFTSGTTGEPKGAVFCNRQLAAITMFDNGGTWGSGGPMLSSTEMCHVGLMTKLPWYLRAGSRIHLLRKWRAEDALRTICEQKMPSVGGIGAQVALMLRLPNFDDYDVSSVKAIIVGGGPSPKALIEEARSRFGAAYSVRYSSTESGGVGTLTAFDAPDEETLYTVGRARDGIDLVICDEKGRPVTDGEVGEVTLRSPAMLTEYWNDPEATAATIRDGWLHTQDLGSIDESGCLRLAGRSKEMFIRGGYNIYPMEVEAVLSSHPAVAHVAVVPRPDPVMGEIGVAVVVLRSKTQTLTLEDLRSFAADKLAAYKLPEDLLVVDELPTTGMQKIDRRKLTDQLAGTSPGHM
ncbi:MAG: class I adenylate-forming enzyme family protein [Actinomycetota bacterium]